MFDDDASRWGVIFKDIKLFANPTPKYKFYYL